MIEGKPGASALRLRYTSGWDRERMGRGVDVGSEGPSPRGCYDGSGDPSYGLGAGWEDGAVEPDAGRGLAVELGSDRSTHAGMNTRRNNELGG